MKTGWNVMSSSVLSCLSSLVYFGLLALKSLKLF